MALLLNEIEWGEPLESLEHERFKLLAKLQQLKASKPRAVSTLSSTIAALFQKQLSEEEVRSLLQSLASQGHIAIAGTKVTYARPADH